jgi:hypothetical protein
MVFSAIIVILITQYFLENFPLPCPLSTLVHLVSPPPECYCKKPTPVRRGKTRREGRLVYL